jgi:hypothetical protein
MSPLPTVGPVQSEIESYIEKALRQLPQARGVELQARVTVNAIAINHQPHYGEIFSNVARHLNVSHLVLGGNRLNGRFAVGAMEVKAIAIREQQDRLDGSVNE